VIGTTQAPNSEGHSLSDKSPRQSLSKKSGKSIKEKRAEKRAKGGPSAHVEDIPTRRR
jgi:hypothetical protein